MRNTWMVKAITCFTVLALLGVFAKAPQVIAENEEDSETEQVRQADEYYSPIYPTYYPQNYGYPNYSSYTGYGSYGYPNYSTGYTGYGSYGYPNYPIGYGNYVYPGNYSSYYGGYDAGYGLYGSMYGGNMYGQCLGLYGGGYGLYGSGYSSLFGVQNLYYSLETGSGVNYQIPFVQIAPLLGMAALYNQLFPNMFSSSTTP